jgi:hypothetical protein
MSDVMKISSAIFELFHAYRRTDGRPAGTTFQVAFEDAKDTKMEQKAKWLCIIL